MGDNDIKTAMGFVLARLETKKDVKYALDMLNRMQEDAPFDMFDCHQNIDAYLRFQSVYPKELKEKGTETHDERGLPGRWKYRKS